MYAGRFTKHPHDRQEGRLGIEVTDRNGDRWGYTQIEEEFDPGTVIRSSVGADLVATNPIVVVAVAAVGTDIIKTTNGFTKNGAAVDLRGAIGYISAGSGVGTTFYILENDGNDAKVFVTAAPSKLNTNGSFPVELSGTSRILLAFPGKGRKATATATLIEGVAPAAAIASDVGRYIWLKRSGLMYVLADVSDTTDYTIGGLVVPTADGKVIQGGTTVTTVARSIGKSLVAKDVSALATDHLTPVQLDVARTPISYNFSDEKNSFNEVTIGP